MALIKAGAIVGSISGKVGSTVFAVNRGGAYIRHSRKPTNPSVTPEQSVVRANLAALSQSWFNNLDADQRQAWKVYADNVGVVNRLGDVRKLPPLAMYVRLNSAALQNGLSRTDNAPTNFTDTSLTPPFVSTLVAGSPQGSVDITFDVTDEWNTGGNLMVYASTPQNETVNFWKGPYRLLGTIAGGASSPQTFTLPDQIVAGQKVFFQAVAQAADGRISTKTRFVGQNSDLPVTVLSIETNGAIPSVLTISFDPGGAVPNFNDASLVTTIAATGASSAGNANPWIVTMDAAVPGGTLVTIAAGALAFPAGFNLALPVSVVASV